MARAWLVSSRGIARKVKNATCFSNYQIRDLGVEASRECPNCKHLIDNSDVTIEWPGLPAGVKFDPSDVELIQHLAGKVGIGNSKPHMFIDEFIPTLEEDEGICYTHPKNLPGIKKDGSSVHFFHRISNAYASGHRKRRKIHDDCDKSEERVRWHKTGKTIPVLENGVHKGWRKILVLYKSSKGGGKPDKANWVMHQYHIGTDKDEEDGELVVSKIFFQQQAKQIDNSGIDQVNEEPDMFAARVSPRTPKTNTPQPPWSKKNSLLDTDEHNLQLLPGRIERYPVVEVASAPLPVVDLTDEGESPAWWAGESLAVEEPDPNNLDESLLCHEVLDSFPPIEDSFDYPNLNRDKNETPATQANTLCGFSDLDNIIIDTPPDFQLADLQFGSQESITSWLDRL
ncbi:SUPPRESSOR OF GAMMA RESPONSE 1-like [Phoenix dactylifera]|uniref:SUPPRESSOR OF GAMMA RESPONSE 1-like n=1 Tax=Phoenix dactylifera TaxID=42345 RepID=A0A8B7D3B2_PHODC|nr:SUPPRESSOR OF GAMMA RESPONSE 1-like [Phoenix dactylifera]XP_038986870.1 SUPPRESSOR OF GAMMA RESPONSE 1-like [Phoenix dactylifera]